MAFMTIGQAFAQSPNFNSLPDQVSLAGSSPPFGSDLDLFNGFNPWSSEQPSFWDNATLGLNVDQWGDNSLESAINRSSNNTAPAWAPVMQPAGPTSWAGIGQLGQEIQGGSIIPIRQHTDMGCGLATLAMATQALGRPVSQESFDQFLRNGIDMGLSIQTMVGGAQAAGFYSQAYNNTNLGFLAGQLQAGNQIILPLDKYALVQNGMVFPEGSGPDGHYAVLEAIQANPMTGQYDDQSSVVLVDPAVGRKFQLQGSQLGALWSNLGFNGQATGLNQSAIVIGNKPLPDVPQYRLEGYAAQYDAQGTLYNQLARQGQLPVAA